METVRGNRGRLIPPAPPPVSDVVHRRFQRQLTRDTAPELALRRELHRRGLRYRVDAAPLPRLRRRADVVFSRRRVTVFVDGCFWHRCPDHGTAPAHNSDWWRVKLDRIVERDRETDAALTAAGWAIVRVWEHEPAHSAADRVERALTAVLDGR